MPVSTSPGTGPGDLGVFVASNLGFTWGMAEKQTEEEAGML